jgi:hypothetical protein
VRARAQSNDCRRSLMGDMGIAPGGVGKPERCSRDLSPPYPPINSLTVGSIWDSHHTKVPVPGTGMPTVFPIPLSW